MQIRQREQMVEIPSGTDTLDEIVEFAKANGVPGTAGLWWEDGGGLYFVWTVTVVITDEEDII